MGLARKQGPSSDDKRPVHSREVHQGTVPRETTRQGIFRALPEGSISDRGRKLARASVSEYRVYDEAAQRASQVMPVVPRLRQSMFILPCSPTCRRAA